MRLVERAAVLTWLRAGAPYLLKGDFATGDGFALKPSWIVDWQFLMRAAIAHVGDRSHARALRLE